MRKKLFALLLVAVVLCCCSVTVLAAGNEVSIVIDGAAVPFGAAAGTPFVDENGRTQVPLRVVMEQYGCSVHWDAATKTAYLNKGENTVVVPIGEKHILVNGQSKAMDTAALVKDGRTYLPIRPVLEAFGAKVDWQNGKVSVSSPEQAAFENIYVDADGNLIFALANGSKINLGSASDLAGEDGKDGADGKEARSLHKGLSEDGRELFFRSGGLNDSFEDQISGLTLQEAQEQLGIKNVFTFPYQH